MESYFLNTSKKTKTEALIYSRNHRRSISIATSILPINTGDILVVVF
jgi:hypothetical protein